MSVAGDAVAAFAIELRTPDIDTYVRSVGGDDPSYTGQWAQWQWRAAAAMYAAFPDDAAGGGRYELLPNQVLPEWLRQTISGRATMALESMAPALCWLWAETIDWFSLAADHPDVLGTPTAYGCPSDVATPDALRDAWQTARAHGCTPFVFLELMPGGTETAPMIEVSVQGLYIVNPDGNDSDDIVALLTSILGFSCTDQPEDYLRHLANTAGIGSGRVHAWEWI